MKNRWLMVAAMVAGITASGAGAQSAGTAVDPAKAAAIAELLAAGEFVQAVRGTAENLNRLLGAQMPQVIDQQIQADAKLSADQKSRMRTQAQAAMPKLMTQFSAMLNDKAYLADARQAATAFYDSNFSLAEIRAITAFYKSDAGKKLLRVAPRGVGEALAPVVQKWMPRWNEQINAMIASEIGQAGLIGQGGGKAK